MGGGGASLPNLNPGTGFVNQYQPQADTGAFNQIGQVQSFDPAFMSLASLIQGLGSTGGTNIGQLSQGQNPEAAVPAMADTFRQEAFGNNQPGSPTSNQWGLNLAPQMQAAYQTGFDPQQALYDRTLKQLQEQTRSGLEARGVDKMPYGAGIESDALKNFNIDWQNAQQGRQAQAAQTEASLANTQGGLAAAGNAALNQYDQAQLAATQPVAAALSGTSQAQQGVNLPFQDFISYLGQSTNQNNSVINGFKAMAEAALQNQQLKNQSSQSQLSGLGSGVGSIAGLLGGKGG